MDHAVSHPELASREPRAIPLFRVAGIRVRADVTWFFLFALIWISLSVGYFPSVEPGHSGFAYGATGFVATLLLFVSVVVHELAHSWMALRAHIPVHEITLFLFGGVSRMQREPPSPQIELRVALAGPAVSLLLAVAFGFLAGFTGGAPWFVATTIAYLAWINLALGIFNLLPGYPLDGGRVLRALVWWKTGSLRRATKLASNAGKGFAIALMVLGGLQILAGALVGGLWIILIAFFLRSLAASGYDQLVLRTALREVDVERAMVPRDRLVTVTPDLSLRELVDDYLLGKGHRGFPVVGADGRPIGIVDAGDVRRVERERWERTTVEDTMRLLDEGATISSDDTLLDALERFSRGDARRLVVTSPDGRPEGELVGFLTAGDVARYLEIRSLESTD